MPAISSQERIGVAISSSRLPRSRSRTIAAAVKITMVMVRITPISAGTICTAVRRSGLYSVRTSNDRRARPVLAGRAPAAARTQGPRATAVDHRLRCRRPGSARRHGRRSSRRRSKSRGNHDADADLAASPCAGAGPATPGLGGAQLDRRRSPAGRRRARASGWCLRLVDDGRTQVAHVEVDRVAEQQDLHQRDADDHAEREPVARQLAHFLGHDREDARSSMTRPQLRRRLAPARGRSRSRRRRRPRGWRAPASTWRCDRRRRAAAAATRPSGPRVAGSSSTCRRVPSCATLSTRIVREQRAARGDGVVRLDLDHRRRQCPPSVAAARPARRSGRSARIASSWQRSASSM